MENEFQLFLESVGEANREFVKELNDYLVQNQCRCRMKTGKSGYVVSYQILDSNRTLANFVCRKTGIKIRIYAEHVAQYNTFLDTLPEAMKKDIRKASVCKRLINPDDCNPKCPRGYQFSMDGEFYQKCRSMAFMPSLNMENNPFIKEFLVRELNC